MIDYSIGNGIDLGRGYRIGQSFGYSNNHSVFRDEEIEHQLSRSGESAKVSLREPCDHAIGFSNGTVITQSRTERSNFMHGFMTDRSLSGFTIDQRTINN